MEFLLVNHPLDCPICDQGGECDLQASISTVTDYHCYLLITANLVLQLCLLL